MIRKIFISSLHNYMTILPLISRLSRIHTCVHRHTRTHHSNSSNSISSALNNVTRVYVRGVHDQTYTPTTPLRRNRYQHVVTSARGLEEGANLSSRNTLSRGPIR